MFIHFLLLSVCNLTIKGVYAPKFDIVSHSEEPTIGLGLRVHCNVKNTGNAEGEAAIDIELELNGKKLVETKRETLKPGDSKTVTAEFSQDKIGILSSIGKNLLNNSSKNLSSCIIR